MSERAAALLPLPFRSTQSAGPAADFKPLVFEDFQTAADKEQKSVLRSRLGPPSVVRGPDRLPTAARTFIGRENELAQLKKAWDSTSDNADPAQKTNVLVFHAVGGAGKSALLQQFLHPSDGKRFLGAVYEWSAYSQGSGDNRTANADAFISSALKHYGHDLVKQPIKDAVERGRELARLVSKQRTLMILDGIEPLQDIPLVNGGRLRDQGLAEFIKRLAQENKGLLLITSRQELPELVSFRAPQVITSELDRMTLTDGVELLAALGVQGYRSQMKKTVEELYGHALSLNLLGAYLSSAHGGDVNQREQFRLGEVEEADAKFIGDATVPYARRAARIMEGTLRRLDEAETAILHMVGLFDRPAEREALDALLAEPTIPGLTEAFHGLTAAQRKPRWNVAVERLRKLKLLSAEDNHQPGSLDAHPIVRAHFGDRLKGLAPESFREAHGRLYDFYRYHGLPSAFRNRIAYAALAIVAAYPDNREDDCRTLAEGLDPGDDVPETLRLALPEERKKAATLIESPEFNDALQSFLPGGLDGMLQSFYAIRHGCSAERHQEVFSEVYVPQIQRGNKHFLVGSLGATGTNLSALAEFFEVLWLVPAQGLRENDKANILSITGFALRAVTRLREAIEPYQVCLKNHIAKNNIANIAVDTNNISELHLTLGDIGDAIDVANQSIAWANKSDNTRMKITCRVTLATALSQAGRTNEALAQFAEAETILAKWKPDMPKLFGSWGYHYCDLLLAQGRTQEVVQRAQDGLKANAAIGHSEIIHIALENRLFAFFGGSRREVIRVPAVRGSGF